MYVEHVATLMFISYTFKGSLEKSGQLNQKFLKDVATLSP